MIKSALIALFSAIFLFISSSDVLAIYDPVSVPNNKYGIHIISENDLPNAKNLVNSSGGDWGYVTIVITQDERDPGRWQKVFDEMRRHHLIPIIRIATRPEDGIWTTPNEADIDNWVKFFLSLNWVIKNRYVIISNEPNHSKEWGGTISPEGYASYLKAFSLKLKASSEDFFVLPAGLDASSSNSRVTMEEVKFINGMLKKEPDIFSHVDGWVSHSYPNPGFSGLASETGRGTISTFAWELSLLKSLGIDRNLPVFITETGWSNKSLSEEEIAAKLTYGYENVWADERVVAVTPFILNYPEEPFREFSWLRDDGSYSEFYTKISSLTKVAGAPIQEVKGKIIGAFSNPFVNLGTTFKGVVLAQNLGQSIWVFPNISIKDGLNLVEISTDKYEEIEPFGVRLLYFHAKAPETSGKFTSSLVLKYNDKEISEVHPLDLYVVTPTEVKKLGLFAKIQVYIRSILTLGR
jgi:hypothetical protein